MSQILTDEDLDSIQREKYAGPGGAQRLSENIIAIFGTTHPDGQTVDGPITVRQPSPDVPALVIEPFPDATVPAFSGGGGGGGGGLPPSQATFPGPSPPPPSSLAPQFPIMLYGVVQSGTGKNYTVRCWITDPSSGTPLGDFACTQEQIDPSETIDPGTNCLIWCGITTGNKLIGFRMTVPVFLG
jgi:hypothetical protein